MSERFTFRGRQRVVRDLERARVSFTSALTEFKRALESADVEAKPTQSEWERARMDGWLAAMSAVAREPLLNDHEAVRAALLAELEALCTQYCERQAALASPAPTPQEK